MKITEIYNPSQEPEDNRHADLGRRQGRKWAEAHATPEQLERLAAARDPIRDWYIGEGSTAYSEGDNIASILLGPDEFQRSSLRGSFNEMISEEFEDLEDDPDFVQGFAEGCLEVLDEISPIRS